MIQAELYIAQNAHSRDVWGGFLQWQVIRCRHEKPHTSERDGLFCPSSNLSPKPRQFAELLEGTPILFHVRSHIIGNS